MNKIKGSVLLLLALFALYGAAGIAKDVGFSGASDFLSAQAAQFSAQYHAAKAEQAAQQAVEAVSASAVQ